MAFNPKQLPSRSGPSIETIEEDVYPARLARIIELGRQEDKYGIKRKVVFGFTLPDVMITIKDEQGNDVERQRMMWTFPINLPEAQNPDAKIQHYINALNKETEGWGDLLEQPCQLDIEEKEIVTGGEKRMVNNIRGITKAPRAMFVEEPDCETYIFDFYDPEIEVWNKLSDNRKEQIKKAVDFNGSALEAALEGSDATGEDAPV